MSPARRKPAYETADAPPWIGAVGLATLGVLVVLALGLGAAALRLFGHERPAEAPLDVRPPAPRLETRGGGDLRRVRAVARARLGAYGWADRQAGLARLPIDQAMRIVARRGWADPETAP